MLKMRLSAQLGNTGCVIAGSRPVRNQQRAGLAQRIGNSAVGSHETRCERACDGQPRQTGTLQCAVMAPCHLRSMDLRLKPVPGRVKIAVVNDLY